MGHCPAVSASRPGPDLRSGFTKQLEEFGIEEVLGAPRAFFLFTVRLGTLPNLR